MPIEICFLVINNNCCGKCTRAFATATVVSGRYYQILCILKHVQDVEDRSNTPKACNTMYVKDVKDGKRAYTHIFAHNFLNIQPIFNSQEVLKS